MAPSSAAAEAPDRRRAIAARRPVPLPSARRRRRSARAAARKPQELRRTAKHASDASVASGKDATAGADPNHRSAASKPGLTQSTCKPGVARLLRGTLAPIAGGDAELGEWTPRHALAPGLHLV